MKDWTVVEIYSDEGISASSLSERPMAMKLLSDAKKGLFENVLILKVDRLCRNTRDLLEIIDHLKKYNVRLNAVDEQIDYTTPTGKMMLTLLGSFAELERSTITERMLSGRQQKVRTGIKSKTGKILFGYDYIDNEYIANEEQANIVRLIYNKILEGSSLRSVAKYLLDNKVEGKWTASSVKRLLINPTYKGYTFTSLYKHPAKYVDFESAVIEKAKNVEAIVSEELYDQVNNILESRKGNNTRKFAKSDFYFADVAYCNNCGWKLASRNAKNYYNDERRKYYRCLYNHHNLNIDRCNFSSIENSVLEELFLNYLEDINVKLENGEYVNNENLEKEQILIENLELNKEKVKFRKEKLLEKFLDGLIQDDQYTSTSIALSNELEEIELKLEELNNKKSVNAYSTYAEFKRQLDNMNLTVREIWKKIDDNQKRILVTSLVKKINISKSCIDSIEFN